MRCPNCNAWVGEGELFCGECGTRIARPTPPEVTPAEEVAAKNGGASKALLGGGAAVAIAGAAVVVVCLCLVVLVVASGVLNPAEPTPTRVAQATKPPTPQLATATPKSPTPVQPTPTFRPSPSSTRPAATAPSGLVFTDDFDDESGGWKLATGTRGKNYIADGELHIEMIQAGSIAWSSRTKGTWADMVFEVDARQVAGSDHNDYGVMFRYQDAQNFYRFIITGESRYQVSKYVNGQWSTLVNWKSSSAIKKGVATNHLKVVCRGNAFECYVNDAQVTTFTDGDLDEGGIGLAVGSYDTADVYVAFDNVCVIPGHVVFYDDLADNRNDWPEHAHAFFENGEYHIYDESEAHAYWNTKAGDFDNVTIEARIRKVEGRDDMAYGLVFRVQDIDNFYNFVLTGDGRYVFGKREGGQWGFIIGPKRSSVVNEDNSTNVLRVVCRGQSFEFYINDQKVDSFQDGTFGKGKIGFHADGGVHLAADYVAMWGE